MGLWVVLSVMTAIAALILVVPMLRARRDSVPAAAREIAVYADQLAEVDRDAQRGLIGDAESIAARTEISRRILRAGENADANAPVIHARARVIVAIIVCVAVPALSVGLYLNLGSPSMPDETLAARKAAPVEKLSPDELIARLDAQLAANPTDLRGWDIAGPIYLRMGRFADAVHAFQTAIKLGGVDVRRQTGLGEALTANAQGVVTPEARAAFEAATKLYPTFPLPKMYLALALSQDGKLQESADAWRKVIGSAPAAEPWVQSAKKELRDVEAKIAAQNGGPVPPVENAEPAAPTPNSAPASSAPSTPGIDPGAQAMIQGMVARLRERLDTEGGTADDWGKLMRSYLVLGRSDDAKSTYEKAKSALAADATASAKLAEIANDLGIAQ